MASTSATTSPPATEPLPSEKELSEASTLQVFGPDGKSRPFSSLYDDIEKSTMVIFIRHFYCGDCQDYIRALAASIKPQEVEAAGKRLFVVGCGDHSVIANYATATGCPFEIYSDSTGKLYDVLGMGRSLARGKQPGYVKTSLFSAVLTSIGQGLKWGTPLKGGDIQRIGGEWLWVKGKPAWCHRMKTTRDHLEIPEIRAILELKQSA